MLNSLCSLCRNEWAAWRCECQVSPTFLCGTCLPLHRQNSGSHDLEHFAQLCVLCAGASTLVCCCTPQRTLLCEDCLQSHKAQHPQELHVAVPLSIKTQLNQAEFLKVLAQKQHRLETRKAELFVNLQRLEVCEAEFLRRSEELERKLQTYKNSTLQALQSAKESLTRHLQQAVQEADLHVSDDNYTPSDELVAALRSDSSLERSLFAYHLLFDSEALSLALQLNFELKSLQFPDLQIPWITNKSLRLYDTAEQTWGPLWTFSKIFASEHSSVLPLPDGAFLVSGSSSAVTEVLCLRPSSKTLTVFPRFRVARMGHGMLWWRERACAFGGYDVRACEQLNLKSSEGWTSLGDMIYSRKFFNPCAFGQLAYLCGGDSTNTVETLDGVSLRFSLLPFTLPCASNSLTSIWQGSLYVFQEDFVVRWVLGAAVPEVSRRRLVDARYEVSSYCFSSVGGVQQGQYLYAVLYYKKLFVRIDLAELSSVRVSLK